MEDIFAALTLQSIFLHSALELKSFFLFKEKRVSVRSFLVLIVLFFGSVCPITYDQLRPTESLGIKSLDDMGYITDEDLNISFHNVEGESDCEIDDYNLVLLKDLKSILSVSSLDQIFDAVIQLKQKATNAEKLRSNLLKIVEKRKQQEDDAA